MSERITRALELYREAHLLRAALQLIPFGVGAALDTYLGGRADALAEERMASLLEAFASDLRTLSVRPSDEYIQSERYLQTLVRVLASVREPDGAEKLPYAKNLIVFATLSKPDAPGNADLIDAALDMLVELKPTEIRLLRALSDVPGQRRAASALPGLDELLGDYFVGRLSERRLLKSQDGQVALTPLGQRFLEIISSHVESTAE